MERRVFIAILLSFVVLYGYQTFFAPPPPAEQTAASGAPAAGAPATATPGAAASELVAPAPASAAAMVAADAERDVQVETAQVSAVFTNRGARLKSWKLKNFKDVTGDALELVPTDLAGTQPLPFTLRTDDAAMTATLNGALYAVRSAPSGGVQTTPTPIVFEYQDASGLHAIKEFTIEPAQYVVRVKTTVTQGDRAIAPSIVWGPGLGDPDAHTERYSVKAEALYSVAGDVSRVTASTIGTTPNYEDDFEYVGIDDHYFTSFAIKPGRSKVAYAAVPVTPAPGSSDPARALVSYTLTPGNQTDPIAFYVGPKDFDSLAVIDRNLTKAINFGMFAVIVVPLLRTLNWIHGFVGNYGWSIFILTLLINLVLFPLNHKSVVSMRKMQEIQPETKAIQERYAKLKATDPARQKMNQELMQLYRERGVNPASGCIPILLTLPVFLAFYALLTTAIELRGAPFIGWIQDLSQPDPFYVMPILVGASQIVMQLMTPSPGMDPTQQKIMMIMPVVLIFLFVSTPAGALIYWLIGNVWRMGQQYLTNYLIGPPNIRTPRPPAERRMKRAGSGKTEAAAAES